MGRVEQRGRCMWGAFLPCPLPDPLGFHNPLREVFPLLIQTLAEADIEWEELQNKGSFVDPGLANSLAKFLCPPPTHYSRCCPWCLPPVWVCPVTQKVTIVHYTASDLHSASHVRLPCRDEIEWRISSLIFCFQPCCLLARTEREKLLSLPCSSVFLSVQWS